MSETQNENLQSKEGDGGGEHKTPTKRTPSKRMSIIERAQRESEELIKNMGGSLDVEGGRRTRSSARGTTTPSTPSTPPPAKKARSSTTTPRRGRPKKNEAEVNNDDDKIEKDESTTPKKADSVDATNDKKDQEENCLENDVATADTDVEKTTEITKSTAEVNQESVKSSEDVVSKDEEMESISEETDTKQKEKESSHLEKSTPAQASVPASATVPSSAPAKVLAPAEPVTKTAPTTESVTIEKIHETKPESATKVDPIEPMEVDGSTTPNVEKKTSNVESNDTILLQETTKNDVAADDKTSEVHENSIDLSVETSPPVEESKVDECKTGNDVCEPKISSPTSTGEVVAAQKCN